VGTTGNAAFDAYYDSGVSALVSGGRITPTWSPDNRNLAFLDGPPDDRRAWQIDLVTGDRRELVDVATMRSAIEAVTGVNPPGSGLPFTDLAYRADNAVLVHVGADSFVIDLESGSVVPHLPQSIGPGTFYDARYAAFDPMPVFEVPSPDGLHLLGIRNHNVVVRSALDGREVFLTRDGTAENQWHIDAVDEALALFTPELSAVTNWSPEGGRIAAYQVNYSGVKAIPQVHNLKRTDEVVYRYFACAGGTFERSTLYVLDVFGSAPVELDLGDTTNSYLLHAGWFPGGQKSLVFRLSRDCLVADVLIADAASGEVRKVFTERGETFLRTFHDVYTGRKLGLWITPDGERLIWISERSGTKQLYLYDLSGVLVRQLTSGDYPIDYVVRIGSEFVYLTAHSDSDRPYDTHLQRVPLDGGVVETITEDSGVHAAQFSPNVDYFIDTWSRPDQPPTSSLRRTDGTHVALLSKADSSQLHSLGWEPPREFKVTAADGLTELWGTMYFPNDFDETSTYPLIEHIYGGPYWAVAPHTFEYLWYTKFSQALAQFGYVVAMVDARGTPERSKMFHDYICNNWAGSVQDHAKSMHEITERNSFLSRDRIGIFGHSWGGYFAFRCLADHPEIYRAAVAYAPAFDVYAAMYYESYLGFPQQNRTSYQAAETYRLADRVEGDLMIACGSSDHFQWSDAVKMSEALIQVGKSHEFVVLPEQGHFFDPRHDRYFWRKVAAFFARTLHPASEYEMKWSSGDMTAPAQQTTPRW